MKASSDRLCDEVHQLSFDRTASGGELKKACRYLSVIIPDVGP